jgi:magnesium chelatase subunit I
MMQPFPFSAIVGQHEVKHALLISAVDPGVGGVLVLGDRGTGKSTAVRGLAALLPAVPVVDQCLYNLDPAEAETCDCAACSASVSGDDATAGNASRDRAIVQRPVPVVDLPLGVTEDRVVGAFDLEHALNTGERRFKPGLLADAHRGFLYVDEVNLLEDHIVDVLLDVAASGVNVVERDGISVRHPSRFVLIGTGNPEEGELRPQLLDRFGLSVEVKTPDTLDDRVAVVARRDEYDRDTARFLQQWQSADQKILGQIELARTRLSSIEFDNDIRESVSRLCIELKTDGLRGDLTLLRAARAAAALQGASRIERSHIVDVAGMALRHRLRRDPLDESGSSARVERAIAATFNADAA